MKRAFATILPLVTVLALSASGRGEETFDPQSRAATIAPLIESQAIAVVHADVARIDPSAAIDEVARTITLSPEQADAAKAHLGMFRDQFLKAGGREVYILVNLADVPESHPVIAVPLAKDANAQALSELLRAIDIEATVQIGGFLCAGGARAIERLKLNKPIPRPEIAAAFTAAGDTAAQILILPTADARRVVEELIPTLPSEIGGGSSTTLTQGLIWAAAGIDLPPAMALRLVVQSQDAAAAQALLGTIRSAYEALGHNQQVRQALPNHAEILKLLTPHVEGDRLIVTLDAEHGGIAALTTAIRPPLDAARRAALRTQSVNNLKQIGLAMHNYHDVHKSFPAAASRDSEGRPLLSWRVHLLPYVEQGFELYQRFHLDEPWDSEHNQALIGQMPATYGRPGLAAGGDFRTPYLVVAGETTLFSGGKGLQFRDISDGTSNTIMAVEVDDAHSVIWTRPDDLPYVSDRPREGLFGAHPGGFNALFADGSVSFLPDSIDDERLRALLTSAGGEVVSRDF